MDDEVGVVRCRDGDGLNAFLRVKRETCLGHQPIDGLSSEGPILVCVDGFRHFGFGDSPPSLVLQVEVKDGRGGTSKSGVGVLVVAFKGKRGGLLPLFSQGVVCVEDGFARCVGPGGVAGKAP